MFKNSEGRSQRDKRGYMTIVSTTHPFRDKRNRIYEHRVILEKYLSEKYGRETYILPYFDVHHIDGNKKNNDPLNLTYLHRREHTTIDNLIDMSNRVCSNCGCKKTPLNKKGRPKWHSDKKGVGWLCNKCYKKAIYRLKNKQD
jgi:hypothetical protein